MKRSRRLYAFSLIELLVVIGLIAILGTLLLMGINKLILNSKRQQTRQTFQNLQAMYSEWDAVNHRHLPSWTDSPVQALLVPPPPPGAPNPLISTNVTVPCPENVTLAANPSPPSDDTTAFNRYGQAVWETRDFMQMLASMPANATALGKMSASSLMTMPAGLDGNYIPMMPSPYYLTGTYVQPANTLGTQQASFIPAAPANNVGSNAQSQTYNFAAVAEPNAFGGTTMELFRCVQANPAPAVPPPDIRYWVPVGNAVSSAANGGSLVSSEATVPVLLDAWGNPIIFVPGGQLGLTVSSIPSPLAGSGVLVAGGRPFVVSSPDDRPFWASAGPDGDFSLGDDNLYSFER